MKTYPYAVIDGRQSPDQLTRPVSCHENLAAAVRAAMRREERDPHALAIVIEWDAGPRSALPPAPEFPRSLARRDSSGQIVEVVA